MSAKLYEGYSPNDTIVMEMSSDGSDGAITVPVDPQLLAEMKEGDKDPMFVTIEVLNESVSTNGRNWSREAIVSVAEQINAKRPDGYLGHLKIEERKHKYPDPQTIWLGAKVEEVDGKVRLYAKGYVLPEAKKLRTYLRKAKAAGKRVAVSVYGQVKQLARDASGAMDMRSFMLESVDWARPGSEGVKSGGLFHVTAEMTDDSNDNADKGNKNKEDAVDKDEILKSATASELKELNPNVVSEMTDEAVSAKEAELEPVVSEMSDIRAALNISEDDDKSAATVVQEMTQQMRDMKLDHELREKVEHKSARKIIKQLVVAEMSDSDDVSEVIDSVLSSESGKSVIQEMIDTAPRVQPQVDKPEAVARKFTKKK